MYSSSLHASRQGVVRVFAAKSLLIRFVWRRDVVYVFSGYRVALLWPWRDVVFPLVPVTHPYNSGSKRTSWRLVDFMTHSNRGRGCGFWCTAMKHLQQGCERDRERHLRRLCSLCRYTRENDEQREMIRRRQVSQLKAMTMALQLKRQGTHALPLPFVARRHRVWPYPIAWRWPFFCQGAHQP